MIWASGYIKSNQLFVAQKWDFFSADAEDVVEIMRETMVDVFTDGFGALDFSRLPNGAGMSSRLKKYFVLFDNKRFLTYNFV